MDDDHKPCRRFFKVGYLARVVSLRDTFEWRGRFELRKFSSRNGTLQLTLEVLDKSEKALRTYRAAGFKRYALQPGAGEAIFLTKRFEKKGPVFCFPRPPR